MEPSGPVQACNGIALPFYHTVYGVASFLAGVIKICLHFICRMADWWQWFYHKYIFKALRARNFHSLLSAKSTFLLPDNFAHHRTFLCHEMKTSVMRFSRHWVGSDTSFFRVYLEDRTWRNIRFLRNLNNVPSYDTTINIIVHTSTHIHGNIIIIRITYCLHKLTTEGVIASLL
jgi:hypothetical protein